MDPSLKPSDIRAFLNRRWDLVQREKLRFLADRYREGGAAASRAAALRLLARFRALHPGPPVKERRAADFASHMALKKLFKQTSDAFTRR